MKKILITGNSFSHNSGTMALAVSAIQNLESINNKIFYYKGSIEKKNDMKRFSSYFPPDKLKIFGFNRGKLPMPIASALLLLYSIPYHLKADLIIENPGETTKDSWLLSQFARFLEAKIFRKKFIIYAISAGPFKYSWTKKIAAYIYNHSYKVLIRENTSKKYLESINVRNLEVTADHAFLLPKVVKTDDGTKYFINNIKPFIGISIRNSFRYYPDYYEHISNLIHYITNIQKKNVLLIPHGIEDLNLSQYFYIKNQNRHLHLLKDNFCPSRLKYVISEANLFVGSRIHACIAAWSSTIPTIVFIPKNDHRCTGMSKMFGLEQFIVDPRSENSLILKETYIKLDQRQNDIKSQIKKRLPKIRQDALRNASFVIKEL